MLGGSPLASRTLTGHLFEYFPIVLTLGETITLVDNLGTITVETTNTETVTIDDAILPPQVEVVLAEVIRVRDYVVNVLDGEFVEPWRRVDTQSGGDSDWRRTPHNP